jgi:[acyl-carrier-protein] S-malonyltransferase
MMMHTLPMNGHTLRPPVFSLVTGKADYSDYTARQILNRWIDHPQLLWDAVYETLAIGADTVIHVGPEPNLIPATFRRLSENVTEQISGSSPRSLGLRAVRTFWRPWLARWISGKSALLRAPLVRHVILEDWLLAHAVEKSAA